MRAWRRPWTAWAWSSAEGPMDVDFSAAHSHDVHWFAVDRDGHVASFESGVLRFSATI